MSASGRYPWLAAISGSDFMHDVSKIIRPRRGLNNNTDIWPCVFSVDIGQWQLCGFLNVLFAVGPPAFGASPLLTAISAKQAKLWLVIEVRTLENSCVVLPHVRCDRAAATTMIKLLTATPSPCLRCVSPDRCNNQSDPQRRRIYSILIHCDV